MKKLLFAAFLTMVFCAFSHEGHNNLPGTFKSIYGGIVLPGKQLNIEYVVIGNEFSIYPVDHSNIAINSESLKIKAMAIPKKGKKYSLNLNKVKNGFSGKVDLLGANRLPIEIETELKGKKDKFNFQVEE